MTQNPTTEERDQGRLRDGYHEARDAASRVYGRASVKAAAALDDSKDAVRRTVQGIDANPLGILVGGLAVGAAIGALLPRSAKERELLAPLGKQLGDRARFAAQAARDAGKTELENLGISRAAAKGQAKGLLEGIGKALSTAGSAAAKSASHKD